MRHIRNFSAPPRLPVSPRALHRAPSSLRLRRSTRVFLVAALFLVALVLFRTPPNLSLDEGLPPRCAALRGLLKPSGPAAPLPPGFIDRLPIELPLKRLIRSSCCVLSWPWTRRCAPSTALTAAAGRSGLTSAPRK